MASNGYGRRYVDREQQKAKGQNKLMRK